MGKKVCNLELTVNESIENDMLANKQKHVERLHQ